MLPSCTSTQRRQKGIRWTSASFVLCCYCITCSSLTASTSSRLCYKFPSICLYAAVTPCLYARIKDRNSTPYYTLVLRHQSVLSLSVKLLHTYEHSNCVLSYHLMRQCCHQQTLVLYCLLDHVSIHTQMCLSLCIHSTPPLPK